MKRYVEVYWTPWVRYQDSEKFAPVHILFGEPQPLLTELAKERVGTPAYIKCPAFVKVCQNTFLIRCPINLNISINPDLTVSSDNYGQAFFDLFINPRMNQTDHSNPFLMDTFPEYLFYANEPVEMELLDPILLHGQVSRNVRIIPGSFDISKWIRPIQYAFEVIDSSRPLEFRAGDPLFMIRFKTVNDRPVKFVRFVQDQNAGAAVEACVGLKDFRPQIGLKKMYELASDFVSTWKRGRK